MGSRQVLWAREGALEITAVKGSDEDAGRPGHRSKRERASRPAVPVGPALGCGVSRGSQVPSQTQIPGKRELLGVEESQTSIKIQRRESDVQGHCGKQQGTE